MCHVQSKCLTFYRFMDFTRFVFRDLSRKKLFHIFRVIYCVKVNNCNEGEENYNETTIKLNHNELIIIKEDNKLAQQYAGHKSDSDSPVK